MLGGKKVGIGVRVILIKNDGGGILWFLWEGCDKSDFEEVLGRGRGIDLRDGGGV